ncbi:hypothetical protein JRQ81_011636 [Phrynocephalus forsythii]|uniref:Uncharacterized protein n=1 Tax=Phrynocephalus forsythii TaxID=171643 RepID=A0A9Q0X680_9SAUR|nr:hypothetical protein JRQ81_011636 [Phrynocephalus forsythii]
MEMEMEMEMELELELELEPGPKDGNKEKEAVMMMMSQKRQWSSELICLSSFFHVFPHNEVANGSSPRPNIFNDEVSCVGEKGRETLSEPCWIPVATHDSKATPLPPPQGITLADGYGQDFGPIKPGQNSTNILRLVDNTPELAVTWSRALLCLHRDSILELETGSEVQLVEALQGNLNMAKGYGEGPGTTFPHMDLLPFCIFILNPD